MNKEKNENGRDNKTETRRLENKTEKKERGKIMDYLT